MLSLIKYLPIGLLLISSPVYGAFMDIGGNRYEVLDWTSGFNDSNNLSWPDAVYTGDTFDEYWDYRYWYTDDLEVGSVSLYASTTDACDVVVTIERCVDTWDVNCVTDEWKSTETIATSTLGTVQFARDSGSTIPLGSNYTSMHVDMSACNGDHGIGLIEGVDNTDYNNLGVGGNVPVPGVPDIFYQILGTSTAFTDTPPNCPFTMPSACTEFTIWGWPACIFRLLVPTTDDISCRFGYAYDVVVNKEPIGYLVQAVSILTDEDATTTLPYPTIIIPAHLPGAGMSVELNPWPVITSTLNSTASGTETAYLDTKRDDIEMILAILFGFWLVMQIKGLLEGGTVIELFQEKESKRSGPTVVYTQSDSYQNKTGSFWKL